MMTRRNDAPVMPLKPARAAEDRGIILLKIPTDPKMSMDDISIILAVNVLLFILKRSPDTIRYLYEMIRCLKMDSVFLCTGCYYG